MTWLVAVQLLMMLVGKLPELIQVSQRAFSGTPGKSGEAKKELVLQSAAIVIDGAAAMGADGADKHKELILGAVSKATDGFVSVMNAAGALSRNPVANAGGPNE